MKRKRLWLLIPLIVAVIAVWWMCSLLSADCITRVSFTGLENMFHAKYEYYADGRRVLGALVKLVYGSAPAENKIYDDRSTNHWYAELEYSESPENFDSGAYLETKFGEDYRLIYKTWTNNSAMPGENELQLMRRAAETMHSGDPEDWSWQGRGARGLIGLRFVSHDEQVLVIRDDTELLRAEADGSFTHIMDCPKRGNFEYYYFID